MVWYGCICRLPLRYLLSPRPHDSPACAHCRARPPRFAPGPLPANGSPANRQLRQRLRCASRQDGRQYETLATRKQAALEQNREACSIRRGRSRGAALKVVLSGPCQPSEHHTSASNCAAAHPCPRRRLAAGAQTTRLTYVCTRPGLQGRTCPSSPGRAVLRRQDKDQHDEDGDEDRRRSAPETGRASGKGPHRQVSAAQPDRALAACMYVPSIRTYHMVCTCEQTCRTGSY